MRHQKKSLQIILLSACVVVLCACGGGDATLGTNAPPPTPPTRSSIHMEVVLGPQQFPSPGPDDAARGCRDGHASQARLGHAAEIALSTDQRRLYTIERTHCEGRQFRIRALELDSRQISTLLISSPVPHDAQQAAPLRNVLEPRALAEGPDGSLFIADNVEHFNGSLIMPYRQQAGLGNGIWRRTAEGQLTQLAGFAALPSRIGIRDGQGPAAEFSSIGALCSMPDGSLLLTDQSLLRRVSPDGTVSTLPSSQHGALSGLRCGPDGQHLSFLDIGAGQSTAYALERQTALGYTCAEPAHVLAALDGRLAWVLASDRSSMSLIDLHSGQAIPGSTVPFAGSTAAAPSSGVPPIEMPLRAAAAANGVAYFTSGQSIVKISYLGP